MSDGFGLSEALSALGGAGLAFATNAIAEKIARHRGEADRGNGALLTLSQMYSQLQGMWNQGYKQVATNLANAGRKPFPPEVSPMTKLADDGLRLHLAEISFLLRSHDPDLPNRLAVVEAQFLQHREMESERTRLALLMQEALVDEGFHPPAPLTNVQAAQACGPVLWNQLVAVTESQYDVLPRTIREILAVQKQLRGVLRLQFPVRRFIEWEPRDAAELEGALENAVPPPASWWRTLLRSKVDAFRKWRAKKKSPRKRVEK